MAIWIGRKHELEWLERQAKLSRLLLLTGVRGVGKTQLAREWLLRNRKSFRWYTIERFRDLGHTLGHPQSSLESAVEICAPSWMNADVVVWDELHLLSPSSRRALFSFLRSSPYLPLQLFLSDEEIPEAADFDLDLASSRIEPFTRDETAAFLAEAGANAEVDPDSVMRATGGLPLLVSLWSRNRSLKGAFQSGILEKLTPEERRGLELASVLGRVFSEAEIPAGKIGDLRRKCLVDVVPGAPGGPELCNVPSYVRSLCLQSMDAAARRERGVEVFRLLEQGGQADAMELFICALGTGDAELLRGPLAAPDLPDRLEKLRQEDLREISALFDVLGREGLDHDTSMILSRLELRCLLLLGKRNDAISAGARAVSKISFDRALSEAEQGLLLEQVQLLNRAAQWTESRDLAARIISRAGPRFADAIRIEQAVSWMSTDPKRARDILLSAVETLDRRSAGGRAVRAQARFQLARSLDLLDDRSGADAQYSAALEEFRAADKPYFAAVTQLNLVWSALKRQDWSTLSRLRAQLGPSAERYGYGYVLAGLDLVEAIEARLFFQCGKALHKVESALKRLGETAPLVARFDAHVERIRALSELGLRAQADRALSSLEAMVAGKETRLLSQRISALKLELSSADLSIEEFLDRVEQLKQEFGEDGFLSILCLQRGVEPSDADYARTLKGSPRGEAALLEFAITQNLHSGEEQEAWQSVAKLERLLEKCGAEPLRERVALFLLQGALTRGAAQKAALFDRAEVELSRWAADAEVRAPLEAWRETAIGGDERKSASVVDDPRWRKSAVGDRERWRRWAAPTGGRDDSGASSQWLVITEKGREEKQDRPSRGKSGDKGLFFLEDLAELHWNGEPLEILVRRSSLRKLLAVLLEHFPESVDKAALAGLVWGESYRPQIHDARIYTSIQRLRSILGDEEALQSWNGGYRWNPSRRFTLVRSQRKRSTNDSRCQGLILQALDRFAQSGKSWVSRSELVSITQSSEATVKRELSKLLGSAKIQRSGKGRAVAYGIRH